jgi:hypothetical protein
VATETVRKHFVLPRALAEEFERRVPGRKQSEQVAELIDRWVRLAQFEEALAGLQRIAKEDRDPHELTPEAIDAEHRRYLGTAWDRTAGDGADLGSVAH